MIMNERMHALPEASIWYSVWYSIIIMIIIKRKGKMVEPNQTELHLINGSAGLAEDRRIPSSPLVHPASLPSRRTTGTSGTPETANCALEMACDLSAVSHAQ